MTRVASVFISYAREAQAAVRSLAEGLQRAGFDVWWDKDLGAGDAFRKRIEEQLQNSDVIVVVWSKRARGSRWVQDEAERGVERGVLVPLRIDAAILPLGFGGFHTLDFSSWDGNFDERDRLALREVLLGRASLLARLGGLPAPRAPDDIAIQMSGAIS